MKALRSGVIAAITIGLLLGSNVGVLGQDEAAAVSVVRGQFVPSEAGEPRERPSA